MQHGVASKRVGRPSQAGQAVRSLQASFTTRDELGLTESPALRRQLVVDEIVRQQVEAGETANDPQDIEDAQEQ